MTYRKSHLDNRNLEWFFSDASPATLLGISILLGRIRGLDDSLDIPFGYPITAIAGRNGSGKTTVLALAACAYHNHARGFRLPGRKQPYYTYSDFFIQATDDVPLSGIAIVYSILYGNSPRLQIQRKPHFGRWSNYDRRVPRTVASR